VSAYIPAARPQEQYDKPLTLTQLQLFVGGFVKFVDLMTGDVMVINEASLDNLGPHNPTASSLAGRPIFGDVVLCTPSEIA
jgi:hypothetical protein